MQAAHCCVWDGIRRLATGHTITIQQTMGLLHTPIRQACHMMKWMFDKAALENHAVVDNGKALHYNLAEPESIDLLELIRTTFHLMEQSPWGCLRLRIFTWTTFPYRSRVRDFERQDK